MMDERTKLVQAWSRQEYQGAQQLQQNATAGAWLIWLALFLRGNPYSRPDVDRAVARTIEILQPGRQRAGDLGAAYMREVLAGLGYAAEVTRRAGRSVTLPDARLGVDLTEVYARPAEAFRSTYSVTGDRDQAVTAAQQRLERLLEDDFMIARRDGEHHAMRAAEVTGYRRIIHPELSESGVCGLCLAASDRIYNIATLLPIHGRCRCTVAPVTAGYDPGEANEVDLEAIYKAAGGTTDGRALKKVRFQVNQHGELGPVLTKDGDRFQAKGEAPKGDPIERARKELAALEPVLASLERRAAAGEDVAGPLGYQRDRVTKLRRIAAAA